MSETRPAAPVPDVPGLSGLSVLARGGFATIYRATQDSIGRAVAAKVEHRTLERQRDKRRFLREARAAGQMSAHPHVVDLHDVGVTDEERPYMIMELCDGSYADLLRSGALSAYETRDVGVKIADALAAAHAAGVLHRDIKPANLLLSRFGEPLLADFGLAVLAETRETSITLEVHTPAYAPPETLRHGPPTAAVDIYGLCATLYAMLSGGPPRLSQDASPSLLTLLEVYEQPVPEVPGVPEDLVAVLRQGMANEPRSRPSAAELRSNLAALTLPRDLGADAVRGSAPVPRAAPVPRPAEA